MTVDVERLSQADRRWMRKMDAEDSLALKACLLATGALAGLSVKHTVARRLATLGCSVLAAGLAIPLAKQYMDELQDTPSAPTPLDPEE